MDWKPIEHTVVKDSALKGRLHTTGYALSGNIGADPLQKLRELYASLHNFNTEVGGMFYSLYSDDIEYREKVNSGIEEILRPVYDSFFADYKIVINSFIVKTSGPGSDFSLHQDSTGLDEFEYSPLSLWIPLQDTDLNNGTLCLIPKTHGFFHPYRGISFQSPFCDYENLLRTYLVPVVLKAGDVLFFDNRVVHYSHTNFSNAERVVVMSGIFPQQADILSVYKDKTIPSSPFEIYKHSDDFLITNTAFFKDCTARPYRGEVIKTVYEELPGKTSFNFLNWASANQLTPTNIAELVHPADTMRIISEPV
ncbi:MAG: phytanoyl-CoA dioxygenase family protein [Bacteroidota bacterium]